jgi:SecD/SecF fusion protein
VSEYFDRVERQIVRKVEARRPRSASRFLRPAWLAPAAAVLVVVIVVAAFAGIRAGNRAATPDAGHSLAFALTATPLDAGAPVRPAIDRALPILRRRLGALFPGVRVSRHGDHVVLAVPRADVNQSAEIVSLTAPGWLRFYDWEASVLAPDGASVARRLAVQDPTALAISQGAGGAAPGTAGAGGMPLYQAVKLASRQPAVVAIGPSAGAREYYLFGAPGSEACVHTSAPGASPASARHCLLAGPEASPARLLAGLPAGLTARAQVLAVPAGVAVLEAVVTGGGRSPALSTLAARFFVLRDHAALTGADITNPQAGVTETGQPDLEFGFTANGARAFQRTTALLAHRGESVSGPGLALDQHFAVALDGRLLEVPSIDYRQYPEGVAAGGGAQLTGMLTPQSAKLLAALLRFGPLPVRLSTSGSPASG